MAMKIYAFYGHQFLGNESTVDDLNTIPDGAYMKMGNDWYHKEHSSWKKMKQVDLPKEVTMQLLVLGLNE